MPFIMGANDSNSHPVWNLYDELRTARLNVRCHEVELQRLKKVNLWSEVTIAIASTSSIGGFWFMQNFVGGYIWKTIGAVAILLTTLKPIFRLSERIRRKQELLTSYRALDHDLHCIAIEVHHRGTYDTKLENEFKKCLQKKAGLVQKGDDHQISEKVKQDCEQRVLKELPAASFFVPNP